MASRLLIEAAKTGESVDIALATGTVERVLHESGPSPARCGANRAGLPQPGTETDPG